MTESLLKFATTCLAAGALANGAAAQTVVVTTVEDRVDIAAGGIQSDLPGPDGVVSFREALIVTNNMAGPQTVEFAIPTSDWWLFDDHASLKLEDGIFFVTDDGTTLDFGSQALLTGDTNPGGMEVGIYGLQPNGWGHPAIAIRASDCVVRGLGPVFQRSASVSIDAGTNNRVVGCVTGTIQLDPYPGTTSFNQIGGTQPGEANVLEVVEMFCGADDNVVIGNQLESARVVGSPYCLAGSQYPRRNRIGGPTPAERNVLAGAGSYSSEGFPVGANVEVLWAQETLIEGNYIGVTPDGLTRVPQVAPTGISIADSTGTVVRDNLVAGMYVVGLNHYAGELFGRGVLITAINADTDGVALEGNLVGTDVTGSQPILTLNGIAVTQSSALRAVRNVVVGGCAVGQSNVVAFTQVTGVSVTGSNVEAELRCNSIFDNGALGIDLGSFFGGIDGVSPNDPLDVDTGGNGLQNGPVLTSVVEVAEGLRVRGTLHSTALDEFAIELFASPSCDPTGFGEGKSFLGGATVQTDAFGDAAFELVVSAPAPDERVIAGTATRTANGATSEFSACAVAAWTDAGNALAGTSGLPDLSGSGSLAGGSAAQLHLTSAAASAPAALFVGLTSNPTPFFGGLLLPYSQPALPPIVAGTGADGEATLAFTMPAGWPAGSELWFQWCILDPVAPQGVAISNALVGVTP